VLVKMETYFDGEFWCARGIGDDIFTQGNTLDELCQNIKEAVAVHYGETDKPITTQNYSQTGWLLTHDSTAHWLTVLLHPDRAYLELGYLSHRVKGRVGELVGRAFGKMEGHGDYSHR